MGILICIEISLFPWWKSGLLWDLLFGSFIPDSQPYTTARRRVSAIYLPGIILASTSTHWENHIWDEHSLSAKGYVLLYSQMGNKVWDFNPKSLKHRTSERRIKRSPTKGTLAEEGRKWALLLEKRCFVTVKQNMRGSSLMMSSDSYRHGRNV